MNDTTSRPWSARRYLVLGATGGIGGALARSLASRGAGVFVAGRDPERLAAIAQELDAPSQQLDATDVDGVESCVRAAIDWAADSGLGGIAHCVGSLLLKPAHRTSADEWHDVIATNLTSSFAVVRAAGLHLRKGGALALCSSAAAQIGLANHEAIAAAKAGIEGLVRSAAATYARRGLRCNAVAPGLVETPLTAALTANERSAAGSRALHALERLGRAEEVAAALSWLLDEDNSWVTGQILGVDGGLAKVRPVPRA